MSASQQFPFVARAEGLGAASLAPMVPLTLVGTRSVATAGLLDTGAAVNVLPYTVGLDLGFDWDRQTTAVQLSGNLKVAEARAIVVSAALGGSAQRHLAPRATASDDSSPRATVTTPSSEGRAASVAERLDAVDWASMSRRLTKFAAAHESVIVALAG